MQYYRCKCGKCEIVGSDSPLVCDGCESCGSNLTTHPSLHKSPKPHDWTEYYIMVGEEKVTYIACCYCHKVRPPTIEDIQIRITMWEKICKIQDEERWVLVIQRCLGEPNTVIIKLSGHGTSLFGEAPTLDEAIEQLLPVHREWKEKQ